MRYSLLRVCSHETWNELIPVWDFKLVWKQVLFTWGYISAAFQNNPIFWWAYVGISLRVMFIWYFITRNEISFLSKWPIWNPYRYWVSQHPTSLRLFVLFQVSYVHMNISCRFEISFQPKWPIQNPYHFEFHFASIHVNTSKELTENRSKIFN